MRICVVVVGTNGDVLPMLSLATGLKVAGHQVRFATAPFYEEAVCRAGVDFFPVRGSPQSFFSGVGGADLRDSSRRPARFQRFWNLAIGPYAEGHLRDTWDACKGFDTAICIPWFHAAPSLSEKLGIHCFATTVMPAIGISTSSFPSPMEEDAATPLDARPSGNRRSWKGSMRMAAAPYEQVNRWRTDVLGLKAQSRMDAIKAYRRTNFLLSYSELMLPRPVDWPETVHVTGFWYMNAQPEWTPSRELEDFLEKHPAPLLVGFSSQVARDPKAFSEKVVRGILKTGKPAILLTGWGGLRQADLPPQLLLQDAIPYDWIVPRLSGFLHHGGCGSMAMCLRHGIPSMAIPFGFDQMLWGKRIAALGLGPQPMDPNAIDSGGLAELLIQMTEDPDMRRRAEQMSLLLGAEDGVANAIRVIESVTGFRTAGQQALPRTTTPKFERARR
jgi:sterol 3beta-glucosyltransferase